MTEPPVLLCHCSCPDAASARQLAETLVGERLAACVSCLPGATSSYRWRDEVVTEAEQLLLIKTSTARFEAMRSRLLELHPYDVPELIAVPVEHGHTAYLDWVRASVDG